MIKKRGFTLIELSIVLVIIALLIASVMGSKKIVANSKLKAAQQATNRVDFVANDAFEGALVLWVEASLEDSIEKDSNGLIEKWYNKAAFAGRGAFLQPWSGKEPSFKKDAINGLPAIHFDSSAGDDGDALYAEVIGSGSLSQPNTVIVVATALSIQSFDKIVDAYNSGAGNNHTLQVNATNQIVMHAGVDLVASSAITINKPFILIGLFNSSTSEIFVNGVSKVVANNTGSNIMKGITVGHNNHGDSVSDAFDGYVAEVIVFNKLLDETERKAVEKYLSNKYKIRLD